MNPERMEKAEELLPLAEAVFDPGSNVVVDARKIPVILQKILFGIYLEATIETIFLTYGDTSGESSSAITVFGKYLGQGLGIFTQPGCRSDIMCSRI